MQSKEKKKPVHTGSVMKTYSRAALRFPWLLLLIVASSVLVEGTGVLAPLYLRNFINEIATGTPSETAVTGLVLLLCLFFGINFVTWVGRRLQSYGIRHIELSVMCDLYLQAFYNLLGHSQDFFNSNFTGTLTRRVSRFAGSFENILDIYIFTYLSTALFVGGALYVIMTRSKALGLALLLWVVVYIAIQIRLNIWKRPLRKARVEADSKLTGVISDAVANHSTITLFASRPREFSYFTQIVEVWRGATSRTWVANEWINATQGLLAILIESGLLIGAVFLWQRGLFSVGDFVLIQVYVLGLLNHTWDIGNSSRRLTDAFADAQEMVDIIAQPYGIADAAGAQALTVSDGSISLTNVEFRFIEERPILSNLSLAIPGKQKIALVGPSGAGKSTITKLLLRLHDVTGGSIAIDGQDISKVTQESLRSAVGFVPQEPILFHRTLGENIKYGHERATDEEVIEAAKKAHCHEFISKLPDGYDTFVGERGVKLSGGERQRVAIARAILKDAPILVLDEATSSLDSESEELIQDALRVLMEGKTVIVIAHRLSTIMKMDRIIVLEGGKIVADGTHDELLTHGGLYQKLWSIQAGGFIADSEDEE